MSKPLKRKRKLFIANLIPLSSIASPSRRISTDKVRSPSPISAIPATRSSPRARNQPSPERPEETHTTVREVEDSPFTENFTQDLEDQAVNEVERTLAYLTFRSEEAGESDLRYCDSGGPLLMAELIARFIFGRVTIDGRKIGIRSKSWDRKALKRLWLRLT